MNGWRHGYLLLVVCATVGCSSSPPTRTLASLDAKRVDVAPGQLNVQSNAQVIAAYREFLATASPVDPLYKEVTQRLADLEMKAGERLDTNWEQQFAQAYKEAMQRDARESDEHYRTALKNYADLLKSRPGDKRNDWVLYQSARAHEELGEPKEAAQLLGRLASEFPQSRYAAEARMRQAELLYLSVEFAEAEKAYRSVVAFGSRGPYYSLALYKLGWSLFKQEKYFPALDAFFVLYDELHMADDPLVAKKEYDAAGGEMRRDLINVMTLSFVYGKGAEGLDQYFRDHPSRGDQATIYQYVATYYQKQERYKEAADVCQAFIKRFPVSADVLRFQSQILDIYQQGKQHSLLWTARAQFADRFNPESDFWRLQDSGTQRDLNVRVREVVTQLAAYNHAQAQSTRKSEFNAEAVKWYKLYLRWFGDANDIGEKNFLLAELLFGQGEYAEAIKEYTRTAYEMKDHGKSAEAGYALTVALDKLAQSSKDPHKSAWRRQTAMASLRFAKRFAEDKRVPMVLAHGAETLLDLGDTAQARALAEKLLERNEASTPANFRRAALLVLAQSATQANDLRSAEQNYRDALKLADGAGSKQDKETRERVAAIAYKRAEDSLKENDLEGALAGFSGVMREFADTSVAPVAQFNAAAVMMKQEKWPAAIPMLEDFRTRFPKHELVKGVPEKLALAYLKTRQVAPAAKEYGIVAVQDGDAETRRLALLQSAQLWLEAKKTDAAIAAYETYRKSYPKPKLEHFEASVKLAGLYQQTHNRAFDEIAHAVVDDVVPLRENLSADIRSEVVKMAIDLADRQFDAFRAVKLKLPLKRSLPLKKKAMESALKAYGSVGGLGYAEAVTASTHRVAELYQWMGKEIIESERPAKLSRDEREQYDLQLEEESVPFEEKAIALYETNVGRAKDGAYDSWVQRSYAALKRLNPARYSKVERSEPAFANID